MKTSVNILNKSSTGFAQLRLLYNEKSMPYDLLIEDANSSFEKLTGLSNGNLPVEDENYRMEWVMMINKVAGLDHYVFREYHSTKTNKIVRIEIIPEQDIYYLLVTENCYSSEHALLPALYDSPVVMGSEGIVAGQQKQFYQELVNKLLRILNKPMKLQQVIQLFIEELQQSIQIEAVAIRLIEGNDYPYVAYVGYTDDFIKTENVLRTPKNTYCPIRKKSTNLECTCGLVISGNDHQQAPWLTQNGSFFSNESFADRKFKNTPDPRINTRNSCSKMRYSSIGLIPIKLKDVKIGLLQLNDIRKYFFDSACIEFLETISHYVAEAIFRARMEDALIKSEERFRLLSENSPVGVFQLSMTGDGDFYLPYISDRIFKYSGIEANILMNNPRLVNKMFNSAPLNEILPQVMLSTQTMDDCNFTLLLPRNDDIRWLEVRSKPLKSENGHWVWTGVFIDVSAQKHSEEILKQAMIQAEEANKTKSEFLANMSHEIRTPMNSILGFSEMLLQSTSNEKHKSFLNAIIDNGSFLLTMLNDILDMSKIEAGKLDIIKSPVNIHNLINSIHKAFTYKINEKNIDFSYHIAPDFPHKVVIDEIRTRQILINLIGNALNFTHQGYVLIECYVLKLYADTLDFRITISDTGIGIAPEASEKIFEPFVQQPGQNSHKYGGKGLGLAICKRLCELMGAKIELTSEVNKGSTFSVEFTGVSIVDESSMPSNVSVSISNEDILKDITTLAGAIQIDEETRNKFKELFFDDIDYYSKTMLLDDLVELKKRLSDFEAEHQLPLLQFSIDKFETGLNDYDFIAVQMYLQILKQIFA